MTYRRDGRIARITLDRPERGNGITLEMPRELAACVERANLDPEVHVIALAGNGSGFCGGYDLVASAEGIGEGGFGADAPPGSPLDPAVQARNHDPAGTWDPVVDFQMMSRNVRGFMSLFFSEKPVVCKVHGYCVAGGTDMALCSDLLVVAEDAKIGYPPARVWGVPTTALWVHRLGPARAKRLLLTGDSLTGTEALEWGLATDGGRRRRARRRVRGPARAGGSDPGQPARDAQAPGQPGRARGWAASDSGAQHVMDGIARHTPEGFAFQQRAAEAGFKQAVRERDEPFGDFGLPGKEEHDEGPGHRLADAVRARDHPQARRGGPRGARLRRMGGRPPGATRATSASTSSPARRATRPRSSSTTSSGSLPRTRST